MRGDKPGCGVCPLQHQWQEQVGREMSSSYSVHGREVGTGCWCWRPVGDHTSSQAARHEVPVWMKPQVGERAIQGRGKLSCNALTCAVPSPCHCSCWRLCEALARLNIPHGQCVQLSPATLAHLQCLSSAPLISRDLQGVVPCHTPTYCSQPRSCTS